MSQFPLKFPPDFPLWGERATYKWRDVLTREEHNFISRELIDAHFLSPELGRSATDGDIAGAIEVAFRDMEHNTNRPWDPDFTNLCRRLDDILENIGYYLVIDYEVRKLGH